MKKHAIDCQAFTQTKKINSCETRQSQDCFFQNFLMRAAKQETSNGKGMYEKYKETERNDETDEI